MIGVAEVVDVDELQKPLQCRAVREHLHEYWPVPQLEELGPELQYCSLAEGEPLAQFQLQQLLADHQPVVDKP